MNPFEKILVYFRRLRYPGSRLYWEQRYARGGNSGAGSSGLLAAYKAAVVNRFVETQGITSILELGCGDGTQLRLAQYPDYLGLDISPSAVAHCQAVFAEDSRKKFAVYEPDQFKPGDFQADMALSMEVIFHLTEEKIYHLYLQHLFACARRWVVIFSSNADDSAQSSFPHFKQRRFLPDIPPGWTLQQQLANPHAAISVSEFFIFEKTNGG